MAKGTLFGGYRVWVPDEQGNPLHAGRASFYVAGSSTPANVYKDKNLNVAWGTSVPIDSHGFIGNSEDGVWLSREHLYKVVIERRICDDPITWEVVTTTNNVGEVEEVEAEPANPYERYTVALISNLKDILPTVYNVVYVNGWFSEGDCGEPMQFRWRSGKSVASDDGHWIKSNTVYSSNGCWEQIFEDGDIDVRKFGAIPDTDRACDTYIRNALLFATEPHVYTADDPMRKPRTIKFVKEGYYKLSNSLDLSAYTTNTHNGSEPVAVIIYGGVVFTSSTALATLKLNRNTTVLSGKRIVYGNVKLDTTAYDFVYPSWYGDLVQRGKNLILVPNGTSSEYTNDDYVVIHLDKSYVQAKTFKCGNVKVDASGIFVDGTSYIKYDDGKVEFGVNAEFKTTYATAYKSTRENAEMTLNYNELKFSGGSGSGTTTIDCDGITTTNGNYDKVVAKNLTSIAGTIVGLESTTFKTSSCESSTSKSTWSRSDSLCMGCIDLNDDDDTVEEMRQRLIYTYGDTGYQKFKYCVGRMVLIHNSFQENSKTIKFPGNTDVTVSARGSRMFVCVGIDSFLENAVYITAPVWKEVTLT